MKRHTKIVLGTIAVFAVVGGAFASQKYNEHREIHKLWSPRAIMDRADSNGDLMLSVDEILAQVMERHQIADADKDGLVSKAEVVAAIDAHAPFPKIARHARKISDRMFLRFDINNDGKLSQPEIENRLRKMYALADWNDDKLVELSELKRTGKSIGQGRDRHWKKFHEENEDSHDE